MKFRNRGYKIAILVLFVFYALSVAINDRKKILVSLGVIISSCMLWFHRNPDRIPEDEDGIISPTDGKIQNIDRTGDYTEVSMYLGLSDVHSVRSVCSGEIDQIIRNCRGNNYPALLQGISEKNNSLRFVYDSGYEVEVLTGILARRLISDVNFGDIVDRGEEIGFISFGSRCIVRVPNSEVNTVAVSEGDYVSGGESVIARS